LRTLDKDDLRSSHSGKIMLRLSDSTGTLESDLALGVSGNFTSKPFHLSCESRD
jgi:hypothetical protein